MKQQSDKLRSERTPIKTGDMVLIRQNKSNEHVAHEYYTSHSSYYYGREDRILDLRSSTYVAVFDSRKLSYRQMSTIIRKSFNVRQSEQKYRYDRLASSK